MEQFTYQSWLTNGAGTISGTVLLRSYNSSRKSITIQNLGTATLYIGGSTVGTATGLQVLSGGNMVLDHSEGAPVYCTATGTASIRFLEEIV